MRAFVVTGPGTGDVQEVAPPMPGLGQVVVEIARVGVCGTDVEFYRGDMAYLAQGHASYPLRLGHEWCGTVVAMGPEVDSSWRGRRVTGDTMLGCGRCARCLDGRAHVCADRAEIGIRGGWPGALAEQLLVPVSALHQLPADVDDAAGALVEPGGNALRAVRAAALPSGAPVLIWGTGTIGLLAASFARAAGAEVHVVARDGGSMRLARDLGLTAWTADQLPDLPWRAVVDATDDPGVSALALELVEPGGRLVFIGLAGRPATIDSRDLVLKDVTAVGILGASAGLAGAIDAYASGAVNPWPLVAATVGLDEVAAVLAGDRPAGAGPGPKVHVDPRV